MARTTSDPKPLLVTIRLNAEDLLQLDLLSEEWGVSRSETLRTLLRQTRKPSPKKPAAKNATKPRATKKGE